MESVQRQVWNFLELFLLAVAYKMENTLLETELAGRKQNPT